MIYPNHILTARGVKTMEHKNSLQFFILASVFGLVLLVGTLSFSGLTNAFLNPSSANHFKEDTWIGPIEVSGLNKEQATQILEKEIAEWKQQNQIRSQFLFEEELMDTSIFTFEVDRMIETAEQGQHNTMLVTINEEGLGQHLAELGFLGSEEMIDWSTFRSDVLMQAQKLNSIIDPLNLTTYIKRTQTGVSEMAVASMSFPISDSSALSWIRKHDLILIEANQTFSMNSIFESEPEGLYSEEFKTILASTIYKAALESPFQITQRQTSTENPFHIQTGFEAFVNNNNDLVLKNVYGFPLAIKTATTGNQLVVSITGPSLGIEIILNPLQRKVLPYRVQIQTVERPTPMTTIKGKEGLEVTVTRTVFINGEKFASHHVSNDLYFPSHEVQYRYKTEPSFVPSASGSLNNSPSNESGISTPSIEGQTNLPVNEENSLNSGNHVPPGGTSTDSDPDKVLAEDQKKTSK